MKRTRFNTSFAGTLGGALCAGAILAATGYAPPVKACGGFFCSQRQPVDQTAERIIFSDNDDDTITAIVQILYQGPSEDFSWILPVPGIPDVEVSSNAVFARLQRLTDPQYNLQRRTEGTCSDEGGFAFGGRATSDASAEFNEAPTAQNAGVEVLAQGSVGPFDWELITVDTSIPDLAQKAVDWLEENGYDVDAIGADLIRPYLQSDMNLLAVKLQKEASSGEIRPLKLTYRMDTPMIPIKLTAVAAQEDMGVMVWTIGDHRMVPANYRSLELNEAMIDWVNNARNYKEVINAAADEAGSHGFVTEMSDDTANFAEEIWTTTDKEMWNVLRLTNYRNNLSGLIFDAQYFSQFEGFEEAIRQSRLGLPNGVTPNDAAQCFTCYDYRYDDFDIATFVEAIEDEVVEPIRVTQRLVSSQPTITRMYTTLSPVEMTIDPAFINNANLPKVSNVHTATQVIECNPRVASWEAPWRIELPQGGVIRGEGGAWPEPTDNMPFNAEIRQMNASGSGEVVADNRGAILETLKEANEKTLASRGGCAQSSAGGLAVMAVMLLWRRRRQ